MRAFYEIPSYTLNCKRRAAFKVKPHLHDHFELIYLESGKISIKIDDKEYFLSDGDICAIFPNQVHSITDFGEVSGAIVMFSPDFLPDVQSIMRKKVAVCATVNKDENQKKIISLIDTLLSEMQESDAGSLAIKKGIALQLVGELLRSCELCDTKNSSTLILRKIIDYCYKNYTEEITLEKMKNDLFISKYYISYLFSSNLNISFTGFINSLRVSDACRHLEDENKKISDVAALVGFSSQRTFNRVFRELMGITPSEYRENRLAGFQSEFFSLARRSEVRQSPHAEMHEGGSRVNSVENTEGKKAAAFVCDTFDGCCD